MPNNPDFRGSANPWSSLENAGIKFPPGLSREKWAFCSGKRDTFHRNAPQTCDSFFFFPFFLSFLSFSRVFEAYKSWKMDTYGVTKWPFNQENRFFNGRLMGRLMQDSSLFGRIYFLFLMLFEIIIDLWFLTVKWNILEFTRSFYFIIYDIEKLS